MYRRFDFFVITTDEDAIIFKSFSYIKSGLFLLLNVNFLMPNVFRDCVSCDYSSRYTPRQMHTVQILDRKTVACLSINSLIGLS